VTTLRKLSIPVVCTRTQCWGVDNRDVSLGGTGVLWGQALDKTFEMVYTGVGRPGRSRTICLLVVCLSTSQRLGGLT